MEWLIKYNDGSHDKVLAQKYDPKTGVFINEAGDVVAQVNTATMKITRMLSTTGKNGA